MISGTHSALPDPRNEKILIYINGDLVPRAEAKISVFDSGYLVGDGIWEAFRLHDGVLVFLDEHLDRLFQGAKAIDMDIDMNRRELVDVVKKTLDAARNFQVRNIVLAGGVAANSLLRTWMKEEAKAFHLNVIFPPLEYCTDNAAMIARAGLEYFKRDKKSELGLNAYPSLRLPENLQDE